MNFSEILAFDDRAALATLPGRNRPRQVSDSNVRLALQRLEAWVRFPKKITGKWLNIKVKRERLATFVLMIFKTKSLIMNGAQSSRSSLKISQLFWKPASGKPPWKPTTGRRKRKLFAWHGGLTWGIFSGSYSANGGTYVYLVYVASCFVLSFSPSQLKGTIVHREICRGVR